MKMSSKNANSGHICNSKAPLISIIVPFYNAEDTIGACLRSILSQSYKNYEVILVNDGSTDSSGKICREFASKNEEIKIIEQKNKGVSEARNNGIKKSSGDWVLFVDSDDTIEKKCCESLIKHAHSGIDLIIGLRTTYINNKDVSDHDVQNRRFRKTIKTNDEKKKLCRSIFNNYSKSQIYPHTAFVTGRLYRRKTIIDNNIFFDKNLSIYEDAYFAMEFICKANTIIWLNIPVYSYIINKKSVTQSFSSEMIEKYKKAYSAIFHNDATSLLFDEDDKNYMITKDLNQICKNYIRADNSMGSFRTFVKKIIREEPFASSIRDVKIGNIPKLNKVLVFFARLNIVMPILIAYRFQMRKEDRR